MHAVHAVVLFLFLLEFVIGGAYLTTFRPARRSLWLALSILCSGVALCTFGSTWFLWAAIGWSATFAVFLVRTLVVLHYWRLSRQILRSSNFRELCEGNPELPITMADSTDAGNCLSGTKRFAQARFRRLNGVVLRELMPYWDKHEVQITLAYALARNGKSGKLSLARS
jgi:hypothetical protein